MNSAAALVDDDEYALSSEAGFGDRSSSDLSSDGEFFSVDEDEQVKSIQKFVVFLVT